MIAKAADPETGISKIRAALTVIIGGAGEAPSSGGFLSEVQALEFAGSIKRSTIWQWRKNGLKSFKVAGRRLYDPAIITDYIIKEGKNMKS